MGGAGNTGVGKRSGGSLRRVLFMASCAMARSAYSAITGDHRKSLTADDAAKTLILLDNYILKSLFVK